MNNMRPRRNAPEHIKAAAAKLADQIIADWEHGRDASKEAWADALISSSYEWDDGYRLARALERWARVEPDEALVEILGNASCLLGNEHSAAVQMWIQESGYSLSFAVGDHILTERYGMGSVMSVKPDTGQYVVATDDREWSPGSGWLLNAEDVSTPPAPAFLHNGDDAQEVL